MNPRWIRRCLTLLIALSLFTLLPYLFEPHILRGQVGKQTFSAEMALSYARGQTEQGFPLRHFLEVWHEDVIPWAEEVPIYTAPVGLLSRWSGISVVILGKFASALAFIALLGALYQIGRALRPEDGGELGLAITACGAWFPAFRMYGAQVMPDLAMTAASAWGAAWVLRRKWARAWAAIMLASCFKYYAAFSALGLGLGQSVLQKKGRWMRVVLFGLSAAPCVIYIALFIQWGIPNPIQEYRSSNGHGHLSSLQDLLHPLHWVRVFTWIVVKNPSPWGALLAVFGILALKRRWLPLRENAGKFIALWWIGAFGLPLVFMSSFFVHDYYGLQLTVITAVLAGLGACAMAGRLKREWLMPALISILVVWGFFQTRSMREQRYYLQAAELVREQSRPEERLYVLSVLSNPVIPFISGRVSWMGDLRALPSSEIARNRLADPRVDLVVLHLLEPWAAAELENARPFLEKAGWKNIAAEQTYGSTRAVLLRRTINH